MTVVFIAELYLTTPFGVPSYSPLRKLIDCGVIDEVIYHIQFAETSSLRIEALQSLIEVSQCILNKANS